MTTYAIDTEFIQVVKELLDEFVPTPNAKWKIVGDNVANAATPWIVTKPVGTEYDVRIVFFPRNNKTVKLMTESEQTEGITNGVMYKSNFDPSKKDVVIFNGKQYVVHAITEIRPVNEVIAYLLEFGV